MGQQEKSEGWLVQRVREFEKRCLIRLLRREKGNIRRISKLIDTRRSKIYRLMDRYGLNVADYRPQ